MDPKTLPIDPLTARPIAAPSGGAPAPHPARPEATGATSFERVLQRASAETAPLRFSKHAQARLEQRGLTLDAHGLERLQGAVEQAAAKGARDSLVLMDDLALIVSIKNRTVVTAVDAASRRGNVFTNIDSVVLAE